MAQLLCDVQFDPFVIDDKVVRASTLSMLYERKDDVRLIAKRETKNGKRDKTAALRNQSSDEKF